MIISKTPYRLSLFGGGTDFSHWYKTHPSTIIVASMDHSCYVTISRKPNFFPEYKSRIAYGKIEHVTDNTKIIHPSVRECLRFFNFESGIDIYHAGDLPARSGIGSSSSFTVGLIKAIHGLKNSKVTKRQLAEEAIFIEQKMIKESVGCQDQIAAAYGGFNVIKLGPGNKMKIAKLVISFTYREYLRRSILLGFTGLSRDGTSIMKQHVSNISQGKSGELLQEINQISENAQQLLKTEEDIEKLGKLLNDSWVIKRDFTPNVSNQHFNQIYEIAMKNGAVGGKLMGAGGGGFFYFLAPPQKHAKIRSALNQIKIWVPFKFATQGSMLLNRSSINII